jgi:hypothetical protein
MSSILNSLKYSLLAKGDGLFGAGILKRSSSDYNVGSICRSMAEGLVVEGDAFHE